jgi:hypothetical protein
MNQDDHAFTLSNPTTSARDCIGERSSIEEGGPCAGAPNVAALARMLTISWPPEFCVRLRSERPSLETDGFESKT